MGASKLRLMTNNPKKRAGLMGYGIEIIENIPLIIKNNKHNKFYLETKKKKLGHDL
jgi:3,4-dihydroxy 2-butanone 4-phosphate synthase/GTP cyclohydrolase II